MCFLISCVMQVCTLGSNEGQVKDELNRLAQAFSAGSTAESPPLPLTTLVIQVNQKRKLIFCMIILNLFVGVYPGLHLGICLCFLWHILP